MAWGEAKVWLQGEAHEQLYGDLLRHATEAPARNAKRAKIVHPRDMPWEL